MSNEADFFALLNLPRTYALERGELDQAYFGAQQRSHPDQFALGDAGSRTAAETQSALLNRAYATLKHPVERAIHCLRLMGFDFVTAVAAPTLLQQIFLWREQAEECTDLRTLDAFMAELSREFEETQHSLIQAFQHNKAHEALHLTQKLHYLHKALTELKDKYTQLEGTL